MRFAKPLAAAAALLASTGAWAHGGHGLPGAHWHATDSAGFAVVLGLAVLAVWLSRDK